MNRALPLPVRDQQPPRSPHRLLFPAASVTAALLILSGCALAPGHSIRASSDTAAKAPSGWASLDQAPEGAIVPITPEVNRTLAQLTTSPDVAPEVQALFATPQPYTIGPGDVVGVIVYDHPELMPSAGAVISQQVDPAGVSTAPGLIVSAAGEITYPYIGRVKLAGLTEVEATELLTRQLAKFIQDPQLTVRIQAFRSQRVYLEGEVRTPGMQIVADRPMNLQEAINRAGGITANGDRSNIVLTRDGRQIPLDLTRLQAQGVDLNRILLLNGDTLLVRNRDERKVYVMGETLRPSALLLRDGHLSLSQALGESGGVNLNTANPGQIYVIRKQADGSPSVFHLDAKNPTMLAVADGFDLQPRDVVYIDPVPLVRWNRVVSLILPSATALNYGSEINSR